ncbi:MAG TPA: FAD-binding and (Fe-S)-binding domain-containing protein [Anaerolineae bacterium]|nr:FAD-binding and (Fe-S)-binding domain-containing protein [Anaerolineae bacterium]
MAIPRQALRELESLCPGRVTADPIERRLYSHDVGVMPRLVRPLVGPALADVVVQPRSEEEVIALVRWAAAHHVPLTPRAKATSGYGGAIPVRGGIVADLSRLHGVLQLDREAETVTVRPSTVWQDLEQELAKDGLALRLYPSSAPSSTVAGWLAQGGVGYGSFEHGVFRENVVSARLLLPSGEVRTISGDELDLVSEAEGITGLILTVTLRLRRLSEPVVWGAQFQSAADLAAALQEVVAQKLPLWSVSFTNPRMVALKNQLPPKTEHGHPAAEPRPRLPEAHLVLFVAPAERRAEVETGLRALIAAHKGSPLADELAQHKWQARFAIMHVKRLGPSLVPAEVTLPLDGLAATLEGIERTIRQPFVAEGMLARAAGGYEATLLGFIPHDERKLAYNLAFGLSLSVLKIAKAHGGRAYSTGLYFKGEATRVLGAERLARLAAFKAEADPQGVMNPGKVLGTSALAAFMGLAQTFEPVVRTLANPAGAPSGERTQGSPKRGVPGEVAWYAYACAQCGACVDECDQYYGRVWESNSPRGKWFFLREYMEGRAKMTQEWVDRFLACTTCEICNVKCPLELPIENAWAQMRGELIHKQGKMTFPPFEVMRAALESEHNIWASYARDRDAWVPADLRGKIKERAEVAYFAGCTASFIEQDVAQGTLRLLDAAGVEFTTMGGDEACCAIPMLMAGKWDTWAEIVRHNIEGMHARGVRTVVTSCPGCWISWAVHYKSWAERLGLRYDFEVRHYTEVVAERIRAGQFRFPNAVPMKVTWHDSCHMGRAGGIYEPPREVLRAIPGIELVEMEHNREGAHCCGSVLTLVENPATGQVIGDVRVKEAEATGAEAIVSSCPCCEVQLRTTIQKSGRSLPVIDLGNIVSQALGVRLADPTPYAMEMWGVFEAMIWLLKPEKMADLFEELFPPMFAAMPGALRGMMKVAKRVPGMLALMKPLMPMMLPMLVPMLMPKVMPDMLAAVGRRVPMPPHMQEQMPDLLPAAMESLMPNMLPLIAPYVVPKMISYIREKL